VDADTVSLVDLFTTTDIPRLAKLKDTLVTYHKLLVSSRLSNDALSDLPLPQNLDPTINVSLPSRLSTLYYLVKDTIAALLRLPFFFIPLIMHIPIYIAGILGGRLVEDEFETYAQMKIALGLVCSFLIYPVMFFTLWAVFKQVPLSAAISAGAIWLLRRYHSSLIDENYNA
jgi:glycerol-3-phosphate O-acyltransferase/dihydroxyacetone phosphate acyltransferase